MKKLIENVTARLSQILREMRLLVVWLGALGILFSCVVAEESGGVAVSPDFSANDVAVTFDGEGQGSVSIEEAADTNSNPTLVISGLTNANDNPTRLTGVINITERVEYFTASTTSIDFDDAMGFKMTTTTLPAVLTVTNLSTGQGVDYDVRIEFTGAPVAEVVTEDLFTATLGNQAGVISISGNTLTIELFNSAGTITGSLAINPLPDGYMYSGPTSYTFTDPDGTDATEVTGESFTVSEVDDMQMVVGGNTVTYTVMINYLEPRSPLLPQDITATFGSDTGTVGISGTDITITGFRNYGNSLMSNNMSLAFSIMIADGTTPRVFTVNGANLTTTLTNGNGDLAGTGATDINLGTFTVEITADNTTVKYSVTVQFGEALELQVSGAVTLPSGSSYISIVEGAASMDIRGPGCPDTHVAPTFAVYEGGAPTTYTTAGFPASLSPYMDRTTPANNTKAIVLSIMDGANVVGANTLNFNYIVSCEASDLTVGDGSEATPYEISTASELDLVAHLVDTSNVAFGDSHYVLTTDIDLGITGAPWAETPGGSGFNPIGEASNPFGGNFDCNDNTISGLFINRGTEDNVGLISTLGSTGSVSNCTLENIKVTGAGAVGSLVGKDEGGSISANTVSGAVTGSGNNVGGLLGYSDGSISDSSATGDVEGVSNVGGLLGHSDGSGSISDSYATGDVIGDMNVGGLVGINESSIINSYATGNVTTPTNGITPNGFAGGLSGQMTADGSVTNSYATGNVEGNSNIGGLIGNVSPGPNQTINIVNSYARGTVYANTNSSGGLIGYLSNAGTSTVNIRNSYAVGTGGFRSLIADWDTSITLTVTNSYALSNANGNGLGFTVAAGDTSSQQTLANLKAPTAPGTVIYVGWSTDIWNFGSDTELPILKGLPNESSQARD